MPESDIPKPEDSSPGSAEDTSSVARRGSGVKNFLLALKRINEASVAESVRQRLSDYVTVGLVILCILSLVTLVACPVPYGFKLLPLICTTGVVIFYIINRLGIILSLTQRQALLVWQIVVAAFWLGVVTSMLVMAIVFFFTIRLPQY